jgi:predicted glycoside hydrolase/deacetylase ChbG (UPF0249 family)
VGSSRCLIVNADDYGLSHGVNRAIVRAFEDGIVTSASLMVRPVAALEAAAYGRDNPGLCLGLHVDLGEWACRDGKWVPLYEVVPMGSDTALREAAARQLADFRDLVGRDPTHIDSHQHVHLREPVRSILIDIARNIDVPLRGCGQDIRYCGEFYGQTAEGLPIPGILDVDGLIRILNALPPGITELSCHPGVGDDLNTMYRKERALETMTLCNPGIREVMERLGIRLCTFSEIKRCPSRNRAGG